MNFFLLAFIFILLPSCTGLKKNLRENSSYLENTKLNFEAGEEALRKEEFDKAIAFFQFVKSKYPFSMYAALSDLRIADTKFAQKKWLDAASAYEVFIRLHPRHEEVEYAYFQVGTSYFNAMPSNFFLLPSPTTRDPTFAKDALSIIDRFIIQFPDSKHISNAKKQQKTLFSFLAQHNQHVASYYKTRKKYEAAIQRYLEVEKLYPSSPESAESLFLAAKIYHENLNDDDNALELLDQIIEHKKESPYQEKALKLKNALE
jgi:outer membrane protein assembly factor BamD